ncbi:T3SS (YopN, CesT) and YbjN peptide-binding chaperone 1 [Aquihabitans sp. McL0605]|uniref:T3SS (YopN, CesT) and YbjN peptide-binding chaperone 1 n=1 Tax=Aquihabitans sp. McL0605 TaxID=3415671 RepID=UPI003CE8A8F1
MDGLATRLRDLIEEHLALGAPEGVQDQPVWFRSGSAAVYLRLLSGTPPMLRVFSPILREVDETPQLLHELNEINAAVASVRLFWRGDTVYVATEHLAATLDPEELVAACDTVAAVADHYDDLLLGQFGGVLSYEDS